MHIVYCPCPDADTAADLAAQMVERRLAACGNILPGMRSVYRWQGATHSDEEAVLILKTSTVLIERLRHELEIAHPYEDPVIADWPAGANDAALSWLTEQLAPGGDG